MITTFTFPDRTGRHTLAGAVGLAIALAMGGATCSAQNLRQTRHNLSASGSGEMKDAGESEICIFCHTPHSVKGRAPLWNHMDSGAVYTPYSSSTMKATIGQPTGSSRLCLSCHDGTVAVGMVQKQSKGRSGQRSLFPLARGPALLGTDLSDDHPISFVYDSALAMANGQLKAPSSLTGPVRLDAESQVQCTSCHTSHDNRYGKFLVENNFASTLCTRCHAPRDWDTSSHSASTKTWNAMPPNPWPHTEEKNVMANGCENCHRPHSAGSKPRLLNFADASDNCYSCHNGNVAAKNIQAEFKKVSVHPIELTSSIHDPAEKPSTSPRHVACVDCHNPHAVNSQSATAPKASGALAGLVGIGASGSPISPVANEYELCFRCHADSTSGRSARVDRQFAELNTRLEFSASAASSHPVENIGKNHNVPSLISPLTTSSLIYCTDCHNNSSGPGAGGSGPRGPHGSAFVPLLERRLELIDDQAENSFTYALCYKCHSRSSILSDESFRSHRKHIVDVRTACTTCHDSHGSAKNSHLINFNTMYVTKSSSGRLDYVSNGTYRGSCSLTCHGKDHNALSY